MRIAGMGFLAFPVKKCKEKPDEETARGYLATGEYFWNSGIFVWRAATLLKVLETEKPNLAAAVRRIADAWDTPRRDQVLGQEYPNLEKVSIDFAVMEKAPEVLVVQAPYRWDDVGS
jgi:mannose-1-phosphate guanylyltransferase